MFNHMGIYDKQRLCWRQMMSGPTLVKSNGVRHAFEN